MSKIWTSTDAWPLVCALVPDMPQHTTRLVLIFEPDMPVIAELEYFPDLNDQEPVKASYKLVPLTDESE